MDPSYIPLLLFLGDVLPSPDHQGGRLPQLRPLHPGGDPRHQQHPQVPLPAHHEARQGGRGEEEERGCRQTEAQTRSVDRSLGRDMNRGPAESEAFD